MISKSPKVNRAELTRLWAAGVSCVQIAATLGIAESTVRNLRRTLSLPDRGYTQHTPETVEAVKKHWKAGLSASLVAKRMGDGWTRNMVIGIIHRAGMSKGSVRATLSRTPKPPKVRKVKPIAAPKPKSDSTPAQRAEKAAAGREIIKKLDDVANDNAVLLIERKFGQCAWPVGRPAKAAEQLVCGAPIYDGIEKCSYCLGHAMRAFTRDITQPKPKDNLERATRRWAA